MVRTRVGYSGGTLKNPTYQKLGDHTETTQIDFDPARVSYAQLLQVFWSTHNPCAEPYSRQYMSAIFTHDEGQKALAISALGREEARRGKKIQTALLPYTGFTLAEDYHQKFELRNDYELMKEYLRIYPKIEDFVNSTAAARVNGYLGGNGSAEQLKSEIADLGLSPEGRKALVRRLAKN